MDVVSAIENVKADDDRPIEDISISSVDITDWNDYVPRICCALLSELHAHSQSETSILIVPNVKEANMIHLLTQSGKIDCHPDCSNLFQLVDFRWIALSFVKNLLGIILLDPKTITCTWSVVKNWRSMQVMNYYLWSVSTRMRSKWNAVSVTDSFTSVHKNIMESCYTRFQTCLSPTNLDRHEATTPTEKG